MSVNGASVHVNDVNFNYNPATGALTSTKLFVINPNLTIDSSGGIINAKSIILNGQPLNASAPNVFDGNNFNYDATTQTLTVKNLKVLGQWENDFPDPTPQ